MVMERAVDGRNDKPLLPKILTEKLFNSGWVSDTPVRTVLQDDSFQLVNVEDDGV